jgi:CarD family transcriptional regulator
MLTVGTIILHPSHGRGVLKEITRKTVLGQAANYYVFSFPSNELSSVMVPVDRISEIGIRRPVNLDKLQEALDYLGSDAVETTPFRSNFHRIHKDYTDRVATGDIMEIVKVFKVLFVKSTERELGLKDKLLFEKTERLLIGEMEATFGLSAEESHKRLLSALCS